MTTAVWQDCLKLLQQEIEPQQFNTWIRPLQAEVQDQALCLYAPNPYVYDYIQERFMQLIQQLFQRVCPNITSPSVTIQIGSSATIAPAAPTQPAATAPQPLPTTFNSNLNSAFTFEKFVVGKSNQIAHAAAQQIAENPGKAYNPMYIYGSVGLGKTHLMHAVGHMIKRNNPQAKVLYLHSERFVADMVKALQRNQMDDFKRYYRDVNALLIDDIQFFSGKDRSQEEFFHTFNALLDEEQQIILTSDRYHKEIKGMEERLISRFGWGLTVNIDPPDLETRVAILITKAEQSNVVLPDEVAFFIAKRVQSNVREMEGALKRVIAHAHFSNQQINLDFAHEALKDLLAVQAKLVSIDNIQRTVAEYYKLKVADLLSKRRTQFVARARQMAMALAKELTNHSLPEIGDAFGGRDHTTVLHACRKVKELIETHLEFKEDYVNLTRILST